MDIEEIFALVNSPKELSFGEKMLNKIEEEFKREIKEGDAAEAALLDRETERKKLLERVTELEIKLKKVKHIKNFRLAKANTSVAEKRKTMRAEIEKIKDRLYEIEIEAKGEAVTSERLSKNTLSR